MDRTRKRSLSDPGLYINRELSWLEFNARVLEEAQDGTAPLLERLKFLAIFSSNLDEFFMVRVAGLKRQVSSATAQHGPDGLAPDELLRAIADRCHALVGEQYECLQQKILPSLAAEGIVLRRIPELSLEQSRWVKDFYHRQVFPVLTPLAVDPSHPFPHLRNRSLNLAVTLRRPRSSRSAHYLAVVQVPAVIPRLVQVPGPGFQFVLLEDVISSQMGELFQGLSVTGCHPFRITRDSDLNIDEDEAEDLLETIEQEVRRREYGDAVRLEVDTAISEEALDRLLSALQITDRDDYPISGPLNLTDFMAIYRLSEYAHLKDRPYTAPEIRPLHHKKDVFSAIREGDILLHHPYESFNTVVRFVEQAADDPDVLAIKQTLYRTSGDSPIVKALARAAQNGKQVTALVELKARFDEENNISWARALERSGVHVVYGLVGLKTHCKVCLVIRREPGSERLRRYVHLGTGNYNPTTARLYTDLGLLTCSLRFGQDASRLFNVLTGFSEFPHWRKLSVAPIGMRERIIQLIDNEREHAVNGREAGIMATMNSLVDAGVIEALYRASQAGVSIDLIVRGICCLRAGVPGVSDNIRVRSIIGRYLEHPRIFYVKNGGEEQAFLSSADWMPRNLFRRVETMFPIDEPRLRQRIIEMLRIKLSDNTKARELQPDGSWKRVRPRRGEPRVESQVEFQRRALEEHAEDPPKPLGADLFLHGAIAGAADATGISLTELYPVRSAPPELPKEPVQHPDPETPEPVAQLPMIDSSDLRLAPEADVAPVGNP